MDLPREGYLKVVLQMFSYLKIKHNGVPTNLDIDKTQFTAEDWSTMSHCACKEDVPPNDPSPRSTVLDTC